jgi:hypothetical protein
VLYAFLASINAQIQARGYSAKYPGQPGKGLFDVDLVFDRAERNLVQADRRAVGALAVESRPGKRILPSPFNGSWSDASNRFMIKPEQLHLSVHSSRRCVAARGGPANSASSLAAGIRLPKF